MTRHAAAIGLAVLLNPAAVHAQNVQFTVTAASAAVHKSPTTASPIIGRAPRGRVLEVTRDVGSWVRIVWPDAEDGIGYVHETSGRLAQRASREERLAAALTPSPSSASTPGSAPAAVPLAEHSIDPMPATRTTYVAAPAHVLGLGGRFGTTQEFGVTTRLWSRQRFGVQVEALRSSETSTLAPGRVTTLEFAPGAIYQFRDHVTDNVWVRPYVGGAAAIRRASLKIVPDDSDPLRHTAVGLRTFGGTELTFPSMPRFAVSADLGYLWSDTPFFGFDPSGFRVSLSGHWYIK